MKTLTALILTLASLSSVQASESDTHAPMTVQPLTTTEITIALADDTLANTGGECKAVCRLPAFFD
jgi:hypothetical protein